MTSAQTILVATDLSAPARHAVERAFQLAASTGSELYILHAMELEALDSLREMLGDDVFAVRAAVNSDARTRLDELTSDAAIRRGIAARTCIAEGNPIATIVAEADALDACLVVLGARGESLLRRALLGPTAARLLRKSSRRPVLVVKMEPHEAYRCVLVTVDFSPVSLKAVRLARIWAPRADLVLLHAFELPYEGKLRLAGVDEQEIRRYVTSSSENRRERLHDLAATAGLAPTEYLVRVIHGDPAQQIVAMEQELATDLVVVGKHGSHVVEELLLGSVTKHVLAESQCDVLVICDPREAPDESP
ncbi:universal stress protein [Accumulibacter sp.]|jgi:nucleotide-binding universal stress UspA family protein|uniref:universal stress protein n=1 Tax=Accumulibacter sp. TaxID=2053492 RepID=UPI001AC3D10D|nr:universal stress protein [Accumulibacter sp.]MBN8455764.1 universal stress protein [Accumulibacter sp.]MBO3706883.1 universal stress protein [Candidatus Accumulibacter conexus]